MGRPPTSAYLKAFKTYSLTLKAVTKLYKKSAMRQIKDAEVFTEWDRIQQYLMSKQGQEQIYNFREVLDHSDLAKGLNRSAVQQIEAHVFKDKSKTITLESPRVKNLPLKAFFSLAHFLVQYVRVADKIAEEEERLERSLFTCDGKRDISAIADSPAQLLQDLQVPEQLCLNLEKPKIVRKTTRSVTPTRPIVASYQRETISTSLKKLKHQTRSESRGSASRSSKPVSAVKVQRPLTTEIKLRPKSYLK